MGFGGATLKKQSFYIEMPTKVLFVFLEASREEAEKIVRRHVGCDVVPLDLFFHSMHGLL